MEKMGKKCKELMMSEMEAMMKERPNIFVTNYMGLTTGELESLRTDLDKWSVRYFVVKNSFVKKVFRKINLDDAAGLVDGGVGLGLAGEDIISACKALVKFSKDHRNLKIKAAFFGGKIVSSDRVKAIAGLPAREVLIAQVVSGIKSPITGFVMVLGGVLRKFVYCVEAIRRSREAQGQRK